MPWSLKLVFTYMLQHFRPPSSCRLQLSILSKSYSRKVPSAPHLPWPGRPSPERGTEMIWLSRELSYLLRHGATKAGLRIRSDGYVELEALLKHRSLQGLDFDKLETIVRNDPKKRYRLSKRPCNGKQVWFVRANQGHSIPHVLGGLTRLHAARQITMAVHGTTMNAWNIISKQGLSRMSRDHIHFAQSITGEVISGMRASSEVYIFIDVARAIDAGLAFYLSSNDVVLTPGNEKGLLEPRFFSRVEVKGVGPMPGWLPSGSAASSES
ncbi:tRNA 2'-phosphotransferase [Favolaschia claudopus]|uniref:2'-phosphotransferase n=1 Tax=Favolaschia claudopus TaxID=2862362 RepID=A0AAW0BWF2_9AGAR